jgi:antitoxin ParD1/3/4
MQAAEKLSISLPKEMTRIIRAKVEAGSYSSNSEVIREAMRPWFERERKLAELDAAIERGMADARAGLGQSVAEVREEMMARIAARTAPSDQ